MNSTSPCRFCEHVHYDRNAEPCASCQLPADYADSMHSANISGRHHLPQQHPLYQPAPPVPGRIYDDPTRPDQNHGTKICKECGEEKSYTEFSSSGVNRRYRLNTCKACVGAKIGKRNHERWISKTLEEKAEWAERAREWNKNGWKTRKMEEAK